MRSFKWPAVLACSFLSVRLLSLLHFSLLPALLSPICNFIVIYIYHCIYFCVFLFLFLHFFVFLPWLSLPFHPLRNSGFKVPFCFSVCTVFSKSNLLIYNDDGGNRFIWNVSMLLLDYLVWCIWSYCHENWKSTMVCYLCDKIWLWYKIFACWVEKMALRTQNLCCV